VLPCSAGAAVVSEERKLQRRHYLLHFHMALMLCGVCSRQQMFFFFSQWQAEQNSIQCIIQKQVRCVVVGCCNINWTGSSKVECNV
jgi:hypothetical protein